MNKMPRPTSVIISVLLAAVLFLAIDLHWRSTADISLREIDVQELHEERQSMKSEPYRNRTIVYNRIPKTGSTAFTQVAYKLCKENEIYVLHLNTTVHSKNAAILTLQDRTNLAYNISNYEKRPAFIHGHFAFFALPEPKPLYINMIRDPLSRLVSYYYFLRHGDNYRKELVRSKQGDLTTFDDCVKGQLSKDCSISKMWMQVPYFCGQIAPCWETGSQWALDRAKTNLINEYFLVGLNEKMEQFVELLEAQLPYIFKGGLAVYRNQEPIRVTNHKDPVSDETKEALGNTRVWRMEYDFYNFARKIFEQEYTNSFDNGKLKGMGYFYEKVYGPKGKIIK